MSLGLEIRWGPSLRAWDIGGALLVAAFPEMFDSDSRETFLLLFWVGGLMSGFVRTSEMGKLEEEDDCSLESICPSSRLLGLGLDPCGKFGVMLSFLGLDLLGDTALMGESEVGTR